MDLNLRKMEGSLCILSYQPLRALFLSAVTTDTRPFPPCPPPHHHPPTAHSPLSHGTLAFLFQGGVIAAADTHASCSGLVSCPSTPIYWSPLQAVVQTACYGRESWPERSAFTSYATAAACQSLALPSSSLICCTPLRGLMCVWQPLFVAGM